MLIRADNNKKIWGSIGVGLNIEKVQNKSW